MKLFYLLLIVLLSVLGVQAIAQSGEITGRVVTQDDQPAAYVNIQLKGSHKGAVTDESGKFVLRNVAPGTHVLVASSVGLEAQEQTVVVKDGDVIAVSFRLKEDAQQLSEVVITDKRGLNEATTSIGKVAINPMDLPQSVMVIDRTVMDQQQSLRVSDVLMNTSGIYVMGTTGGTQEEIAGRGFSFGSNNTFKNGSRFNNGVMPEISSLERVEVLKGSSAILFGQVAAGGVLNLVTKKPTFTKGGEVSFRTGSYGFYKPAVDLYGSLGNGQHVAYRLNTTYETSGSFRDEVSSERIYFNPSFLIKAGAKTQILVEGDYVKDHRTLDFGVGSIQYQLIDVPRSRFIGVPWSYNEARQKSLTTTVTHTFSPTWQLRVLANYYNYFNDQYSNLRPNAGGNLVKADGTWIRGLQRSGTDEDYYQATADVTATWKTGEAKHTTLFGIDIDKYDRNTLRYTALTRYDTINVFNLSQYETRSDIPATTLATITRNPVNRVGIYLQDFVDVSQHLKLLAGVRYSYVDSRSAVFTGAGAQQGSATNRYDDAFSPRLGVVYQPLRQVSVFASYANSFQLNSGIDRYNKALPPSIIDQYEAGVKTEWLKGLLAVNLTAYQIVNDGDVQPVIIPAGNPDNIPVNASELTGEVTSRGVEVDVMSKSIHGVTVVAGYSYNNTRYTKSTQYAVGSRLRYNPSNTANVSFNYAFQGLLKGLDVGMTTFYVGDRVAGRSTRVNVPNDDRKLIAIPDYFQVDASVGYRFESIAVRMKLSNLLNELSYYVHDDNSINPIAPRMFSTTISYKF